MRTARSPSARPAVRSSSTGSPAASARVSLGAPAGSTPTTRASGRRRLTAVATPARRPPPPTGTSTVATSGRLSMICEPERALPGEDGGVVVGRDERLPLGGGDGQRALHAVPRGRAGELDAGAQALGARALGRRDGDRHHHGGGHPEEPRRERHRLRVVARRGRDHPARARLGREPGEEGVRAAQLEAAAALEHLGLEPHLGAELGRGQERRAHGDAAEGGRRGAEIGEGAERHAPEGSKRERQLQRGSALRPHTA